jgi:hypothetical protein
VWAETQVTVAFSEIHLANTVTQKVTANAGHASTWLFALKGALSEYELL